MKPNHRKKWMPSMYVAFYGILKDLAKEHGYALCVHGSVVRDFDIIAIPFADVVKPHEELLQAIKNIVGEVENHDPQLYDKVGYEPHGRICYTIECGAGGYFDISFTPTLKQAMDKIKADENREKEIKEMFSKLEKAK